MRRLPAMLAALGVAILIAAAPAHAESLPRMFTAGNEAYFQGEYRRALGHYGALVEAGVHDADVYFNLATAHARLGEFGHAILYFERALWLRPGDGGIEAGLATTRRVLGKLRAEKEGEATVRTRPPLTEALAAPISADALAWLLLLLNVALFGLLLMRGRITRDSGRLAATVAVPLLALGLLAAGGLLGVKLDAFEDGERAIVLRDGAELREGPDGRADVRKQARAGQRARLLGSEGEHFSVRLPGGAQGWMKKNDLGQIRPN